MVSCELVECNLDLIGQISYQTALFGSRHWKRSGFDRGGHDGLDRGLESEIQMLDRTMMNRIIAAALIT